MMLDYFSNNQTDLEVLVDWCSEKGVHFVSDEVYACSIYNSKKEFVSVASLAFDQSLQLYGDRINPNLVHIIYGLSKDFCMSGFRVGILYTRNEMVLQAISNIGQFCALSSISQYALSAIFENEKLLENFMHENHKLLQKSYHVLINGLNSIGIPYYEPEGGLFLWISMRPLLQSSSLFQLSFQGEHDLWLHMHEQYKILLTPGRECQASQCGHYRCCYAYVSINALKEMIRRLKIMWTTCLNM